ncbi:uncharacterized protein LY89DRAFT_725234 [Mollisia scopiformis]|uniref:Zn(2)-C6 fungal-type domain-containing protein n=1 Tax=Mollisia scopiformis TaxID=149040 RepID=A0A132B7L1_MOLSC|nr:uncharacterized protein LY89DRAFT_725234 [Mollisia scopiformis]KUJ08351.1 hypothetical protein LY89DRAFT_725234 [Mollisia scopiformis]
MQRITSNIENGKLVAKLSCGNCQRRKRKCDKESPCSACQQAGLICTPITRARLPRGRHVAQRDGDLRQRVARLEKLLSQRIEEMSVGLTPPEDDTIGKASEPAWSSINEEVVGIRELLDDLVDDELNQPKPDVTEGIQSRTFDILMHGDASCFVQAHILESPPRNVVSALLDVYLSRIDPIFKVCHGPSLRTMLLRAGPLNLAQEALKFSVFFTAVNSLSVSECSQLLGSSKDELNNRLKLAAEVMLSRSGLLTTTNLTVLQAFVVYLAGFRVFKGPRAVCVIVGTAVRIGQFLGLDLENKKHSVFETEMRRRIWYSIGILDLQAAFDSGSYSALANGVLLRNTPLHINDEDISPATGTIPASRLTFCDMTFACATHEMLRQMRRMIYTPLDSDGTPIPTLQKDWTRRYAIVEDCANSLNEKFVIYCNLNDPFQLFTKIVCEAMVVNLRLQVRRPMYRFYSTKPPPNEDLNILQVATEVLEQTVRKTETNEFRAWEWFAWNKWYALAIVLAELCEHTEGSLIERAWMVAEASFAKYKTTIHDPVLWNSLEKLMSKAQSARTLKSGKVVGTEL